LRGNIIENEAIDGDIKDSISTKTNKQDEEENEDNYNESLANRQRISELGKCLDILNNLCKQSKQVLESETYLELILKRLLTVRKTRDQFQMEETF
jgi:hypothetical protein